MKSDSMRRFFTMLLFMAAGFTAFGQRTLQQWVTTPDGDRIMEEGKTVEFKDALPGGGVPITVDERQSYQEMLGFGFALTGGSAELLMKMTPAARTAILKELFAPDQMNISVLRLTVGASDMNSFVFSYDDMPEGKEDFKLKKFSLSQDLNDVVPVMQEILSINPNIWVMASPWSAPAWMKESRDVRGGKLRRECYGVYAVYLAKYILAMKEQGITIHALTIQNEPLNSRNTPSMPWSPEDQKIFIRDYLGPEFDQAGISTGILAFDHNCDRPDYPMAIIEDPGAAKYITGTAFHHYAGDLSAMTLVHDFRPDKDIYFTEQMVVDRRGSVTSRIAPSVKRMLIDIPRNWSRNVILWNLAADPEAKPHTDNGGCPFCFGAITLDGNTVTRNLAYWVVAHASGLVPAGSYRIHSTEASEPVSFLFEDEQQPEVKRFVTYSHSGVPSNVAFRTPDGRIVLVVANESASGANIKIKYHGQFANVHLPSGAVGTYSWQK